MANDEVTVINNDNSNKPSVKTFDIKKIKEISKKRREKHQHKNIETKGKRSSEENKDQTKKDDILLNAFKDRVIDSEHNIKVRDIYSFYDQRRFGLALFINKILINRYAIRKCDSKEEFYVWNGSLMVKDEKYTYVDVDKKIISLIEAAKNDVRYIGLSDGTLAINVGILGNFIRYVRNIQNFNTLINRAARGEEGIIIPDGMWDKDVMELTTPEGIIDLTNGQVRDIKKEDYRTRTTEASLVQTEDMPDFESSLFYKTLQSIFLPIGYPTIEPDEKDEKKLAEYEDELTKWKSGVYLNEALDFFQTVMGYTLLGTNFLHKFIICIGGTRNGKGLLAHTFKAVLGREYVRTAAKQTFMRSVIGRTAGSASPDLEFIKDARIILVEETDRKDALDSALIKNMTGGDDVPTRGLHQEQKAIRFQGVPFFITNFMPSFDCMDKAMEARCIRIPFLRRFTPDSFDENDPFLGKLDPSLENKLKDREEQAVILNWLVEGAIRASKLTRLEEPEIFKRYTNKYRLTNDILQIFLDERCIISEKASIRRRALYVTYTEYLKDNGFKNVSSKTFYEGLMAKGFTTGYKDGYKVVKGLDLYYGPEEYKDKIRADVESTNAENTDTVMVEVEFDVAEAGGFVL